ncbi:MAG: glycosyltransferase family 4 protein [candidate division WOR-3 bacterium]
MRICLVSSAYRPYISGVGEHVHYLGTHLQKLGHSVHVLTSTCHTLAEPEQLPATRLGKGLILPFAKGQFTLPVGLNLPRQVKNFFRTSHYDIVHCHGIFPPELAYWAALYSRAPVVVTFHTVTPKLPDRFCSLFAFFFQKLNCKLASKIAVSYAAKIWAEKFFPGNYAIIPNGVDLNRFHSEAKPLLPPSSYPRLLFVGRLEKRKGLEHLIRALPEVRRKFPGTNLVVIGYGPLKEYFLRLAQELNLQNAVQFIGPVSNTNLAGYYTSSQLLIAPAIGREAMGIVLIEAMACGVPVIASDTSGYNEVIKNGENGILVPPGDIKRLATAIITVLGSEQLRVKLIRNGLTRSKDFGWDKIAVQIEALYKLNYYE